jgi:hypothetical protein
MPSLLLTEASGHLLQENNGLILLANYLIQSSGTSALGLGSTSTVWGSATTTGNLIVVGIALTNALTLGTVSSVTDSQGNSYTKALSKAGTNLTDVINTEIWYASNITGGAGSVTVNHTIDNAAMFAREYTGFNTLDVTSSALGSSTTPNSGTSSATSQGTELLLVATGDDKGTSQTWAAAGAFGNMVGTATTLTGVSMEDHLLVATGAQTGTLTLGSAANWDSLLASFYYALAGSALLGYRTLLGVGR